MSRRQLTGFIGSGVLFFGVFTPIVSVPLMGSMNYLANGQGRGTLVLVLALVSGFLVFKENYKGLWVTGLLSLAMMLSTFLDFRSRMSQAKMDMDAELSADNPFRELADVALQSVQLEWGWAFLIAGAVLIIFSAAMKDEFQTEP